MSTVFPGALDDFPVVEGSFQHWNITDPIEAIEAKVGVDGSAVNTTLDYLVKAAADPGHIHTVYEPTLTKGDLSASGAILLDQTRQVIGGAAVISHSAAAGYIHLPTGGSANQILKNSGVSGTAAWGIATENAGALGAITTINMSGVHTISIAGLAATKGNGLALVNPTAGTAGTTLQYPPMLLQTGHAYYSSADHTIDMALQTRVRADGGVLNFALSYRVDAGSWTDFLVISASGNFTNPYKYYGDAGEAINIGVNLNTASATVGSDKFSPSVSFQGRGWKTAATAGSQVMPADIYCAPEQGVTNPIGVLKFVYGINASASSDSNEMCRMEFGDRAQVVFNELGLDRDFRIEGDNDPNLFVVDAGTDAVKIGQDNLSLIGFYGVTPVDQPAAVADATDLATAISQLNLLLARVRELGLIATA